MHARRAEASAGRRAPWPATARSGVEGPVTFAALFEEFLAISAARGRSPTTIHGYRTAIAGFWLPAIGELELGELSAHRLDMLYAALLTKETPASPATVRKYHAILSAALNQAVKWQWIASNPARLATLPALEHHALVTPTPAQVRALIQGCTEVSDVLGMFVLTAAVTGCRRGELAALRWRDFSDGELHVRGSAYNVGGVRGEKQTKTGRQRRVTVAGEVTLRLEEWRARCEDAASTAGVAYGEDAHLFSNDPDGAAPVNINSVSTSFRRVATRLGLDTVHFHSLRHFAATQLISAGVDPRTAASRLGHANPSMTLRIYAHSTRETEQRAAEISSRVLVDTTPPAPGDGP